MKNLKIFIIKDWQLDSLNEYLNASVINSTELPNIRNSIIIMSYGFYNSDMNCVHKSNTIIVSADNDAILLSDTIPDNVYQIIDGKHLHTKKCQFDVNSEFISSLNIIDHAHKLKVSNRTNTFFTLNGRNDTHRSMLITELFNASCMNKGLVVYHNSHDLPIEIVDALSQQLSDDKFVKNFKQPELNEVWHDGYADSAYYSKYNLEIITETTTKAHFVTEKTIRPLSARMPFLTISSPGYLEHLHYLGFKTFGDFWDESYDNIKDTHTRIKTVVSILTDLISSEQIYNLYNECRNVLEYNALHAQSLALSHSITKSKRLNEIVSLINKY